jgi:Periplasmic binding protein-like domain
LDHDHAVLLLVARVGGNENSTTSRGCSAVDPLDSQNQPDIGCTIKADQVRLVSALDRAYLYSALAAPAATMRVAHERIGSEAARLLLEHIARPDAPPVQVRTVPALVQHSSTAPANCCGVERGELAPGE